MNRWLAAMKAIEEKAAREFVDARWLDDIRGACRVLKGSSKAVVRWEITAETLRRLSVALDELAAYRELADGTFPPTPTIWAAGVSPQVACCTLLRTLNAGYMDLSTYNSDVKPLDAGEVQWAAAFVAEGVKYTVAGRGINNVIYTLLDWRSEPTPS